MYQTHKLVAVCLGGAAAFWAVAVSLGADTQTQGEIWSVTGGTLRLSLNEGLLEQRGVSIAAASARGDTLGVWPGTVELEIADSSNLRYRWQDGIMDAVPGGEIHALGGFTLITAANTILLDHPVLQATDGCVSATLIAKAAGEEEGPALLEFRDLRVGFDRPSRTVQVEGGEVMISSALADALGNPKLQGVPFGSFTMELSVVWTGGDEPRVLLPETISGSLGAGGRTVCNQPGPDVIVGALTGPANYASVGDIDAFAIGTDSCNIGDENLLWVASTNQHPVIAQNLFRLKDDRFEQVGMSWLKHGFTALTQNICGCGCNGVGGSQLGVGCSDPYSAGLNGSQNYLGPRFEVNAHTGYFEYPYSFQGQTGNSIYKRLQVHVSDLDPAQDGGGLYFAEGQYVSPDDAAAGNQDNNASYRRATVSGGGSEWNLSLTGSTQREQPAIRAWQDTDPTVAETDVRVPGEGLFILAVKVTDLGAGFYHYEYAVQNLNSHRSMGGFTVPIPSGAAVQNIGFHDVDYHSGEPFDGTDWAGAVLGNTVTWSTEDYSVNPDANALRWGSLYNFRFDADVEPDRVDIILSLFRPGTPSDVTISALGPAGPPPVCGDGVVSGGEDCDPPDGLHCDENCQWICGDGVVQDGEECDPPNGVDCDDQCQIIYVCGDGVVDPGEDCDPPDGITCDDNCQRIPTCGDGIIDPGEECDPPDGVTCDANCQTISNDQCADAYTACPGTYSGSTSGMDSDGSASCGASGSSPDVWYSYTPGSNGTLTVETCGSGYDTVLSIHSGCPGTSGNQLVCNDDACALQSQVSLSVSGGTTYYIRVSGYNGSSGGFTLTVTGPDCEPTGAVCGNGIVEEGEECDPPNGVTCDENCQAISCNAVIFEDDFETDQGWVAENIGATSGDWERGVPVNDPNWAYDPASDSDGSGQCYLTENAIGNTDVDNGSVRLTSPTIDMSAGTVLIRYDYFLGLTNADGTDRLSVEINSNDGGGAWTEIARHDTDGGLSWRSYEITQSDLDAAGVTMTSTMKLRFTANDATPQSIVEAALDAFLVARQCVDCNGNGTDDADDIAGGTSTDYNASGIPDECEATGEPIEGGRLYDRWWSVIAVDPPDTDHPLWQYRPDQTSNPRTGADTWRCKECHGWDYKGVDGAYGSGSHRTGFPGVLGSTLTESELFTLLKEPPNNDGGPGVLNGHDYGSVLTDKKINNGVAFILIGLIDDDTYIDFDTAVFFGDPVQGQTHYTTGGTFACIICHGADGTNLNFGTPEDPEWVGTVAVRNPWEFIHKVRVGQPGTPMPSWIQGGGVDQGAADIGRYAQLDFPVDCTQDSHCDDGDVCNGQEVCAAGYCEDGPVDCGAGCIDCDGNNMPDECDPDGDGDGTIDACDGCPNEPALTDPSEPGGEVTCNDGIDNDCDGLTDQADADCTVPDCPYTCGDIDGDATVDLADFVLFANCFGQPPATSQECACSDLNGDQAVDLGDFTIFAGLFGVGSTNTPPECP